MAEALDEHRPVLHGDHGDQQQRKDTQEPADREAAGEGLLGESYRCHIRGDSPGRANHRCPRGGRRLTAGRRSLLDLKVD
ncbi:hypothetical protein GCM10010377_23420 [Streptomyces viridiviolaceus]|nr:hypothetical protein GCM10010377_23420 [Streptomyces viridiviolaceus]